MAISQRPPTTDLDGEAATAGARVVDATGLAEQDLPASWERPASDADFVELATRRFERLPHRPATLGGLPEHALEDLERTLGGVLTTDRLFVIPRAIRHTGIDRQGSVVTPVQVVAVGESSLAVWMDDGTGPRIRALVPFPEVAAILDRNILLLGRLEIVSGGEPVVVHFNTVGRPELRWLLLGLRRSFSPVAAGLPGGVGRDPAELPHKWMALLASTEVQPLGRELLVAAAGDLADPKPRLHNGVAVLTSRELLVATDPTPDLTLPQYGIDLLAVPRSRVTSIGGGGRMLRVGVAAPDGPVELRVEADPSLVHAATTILGPLIGSA